MDTSEKLRYSMFQDNQEIENQVEDVILTSIRNLVVKVENVVVSRIMLHGLQQEADKGIRNFAACIKGQAELCNLSLKCTCDNGLVPGPHCVGHHCSSTL
jgi:hypothetical protein